jgi:hypothetical protein
MPAKAVDLFQESAAVKGQGRQTARQEFAMKAKILAILENGAKTVPQTAAALGVTSAEALWWLMGLLRYQAVRASEKADDDGYYRYSLAAEK